MKKITLLFSSAMLSLIAIFYLTDVQLPTSPYPNLPNNGDLAGNKMGEKEDQQKNLKDAWFDMMHLTAPGESWEAIEYANQRRRIEDLKHSSARDEIEIADGLIKGEWFERGSNNQAGSVVATEYDPETDGIYLISADGSIFYGERDGSAWYVVNDQYRFSNRFLHLIDTDNGKRMLAAPFKTPHYSDDYGLTWTASTGINFNGTSDRWLGEGIKSVQDTNYIIVPSKPSYWSNIELYLSIDNGESYQSVFNVGNNSSSSYYLSKVDKTQEIYLSVKANDTQTDLYSFNFKTLSFDLIGTSSDLDLTDTRANITSVMTTDKMTRHYAYSKSTNNIYKSEDQGNSWSITGSLPNSPWYKGIFSPGSAPDFVLTAGVELFRSSTQGENLALVNAWWEYYSDVPNKLHADFMDIREFWTADSVPFILLSNHGGLSITYDYTLNNQNIGLAGLNVSQYYDVVTDPTDNDFIYAGTQDQGWQKAFTFFNHDTPADFDQVTSGDYGHLTFSNSGKHLWMVYPGGSVSLWSPKSGSYLSGYTIESDDETVWIPPMMEGANPEEDIIYLAGGNIEGGSGSHIVKLEYDGYGITPSQLPFDFKADSGGEISAMEISKANPSKWFVATTNGRFYYSEDGGNTFTKSNFTGPTPQYLYGSTIIASKYDEDLVYFGGSGYSSAAVYVSNNGGKTFSNMVKGLPQTLVYELAANEDEDLIFAGTESGPYMYVVAEDQWYDMAVGVAPTQRYWSVEYVASENRVRFGTYGRGIWDFEIGEINTAVKSDKQLINFELYPIPATDFIKLNITDKMPVKASISIVGTDGVKYQQYKMNEIKDKKIDISTLVPGVYILSLQSEKGINTQTFVKS